MEFEIVHFAQYFVWFGGGVAGCRSMRKARVTEGWKMLPEVAVERNVEEEEVVTVHMLLGKAVTRR